MEDAPVHLHPAGLHRAPLGGQVNGGLTGLSLPALAHGASEALPFAPALPGQGAAGGKGRWLAWGWWAPVRFLVPAGVCEPGKATGVLFSLA